MVGRSEKRERGEGEREEREEERKKVSPKKRISRLQPDRVDNTARWGGTKVWSSGQNPVEGIAKWACHRGGTSMKGDGQKLKALHAVGESSNGAERSGCSLLESMLVIVLAVARAPTYFWRLSVIK